MSRRPHGALVVGACLMGVPLVARADAAPVVAQADALFAEAKVLRDAGRYAEACPRFAESGRLAPGVGVLLYLADCYEHTGKTASAWSAFRAAEARAEERKDERVRVAQDRANALEARLSRITLVVAQSLHRHGVSIAIDGGAPILPSQYRSGVVVDSGDHTVTLTLGDHVATSVLVHVLPGTRATEVALNEPPLPPIFRPAAPKEALAHVDARFGLGVSLLGAGVIAAGVGAGFLLAKNNSMHDGAPDGSPAYDRNDAAASAIGFAVAGAAFASAVALYLTAPKDPTRAALTLAPTPDLSGGSASLRASF